MTRRNCWKPPRRHSRDAGLRLHTPALLLFLAALLLAVDATGILRMGLVCSVLHECGHVAVYLRLKGRLPLLELGPFGIRLSMRGVLLPPEQELALAAAGPLANLLLCCAAFLAMDWWLGYSYTGYWFAAVNLLVGGANLLPLPGLDGARIALALRDSIRYRLQSRPK